MAEVQNTPSSSPIKLFGATISSNAHGHDHNHDHDQPDPKRPDKIIPCPRCKSMETKFCYFNNYNVNQPRHFCKGCQRYWTAGGALRNVPVGAGRRKAKPPCRPAFSEGYQQLDFEAVVGEWQAVEHLFPAKRRRCGSNSQSC